MAYNVSVSTGDVASKATVVRNEATDLESRLAALTSSMSELAGSWTGTASSAFQELFANWKTTASSVQQMLAEIAVSLQGAGTSYDETESSVASQFRQ